jgi:hypothetical protein
MYFKILSEVHNIETITTGRGIREMRRLNRTYGKTIWRKKKGIAKIKLSDGIVKLAELHWYEGHGKGKKEIKIKKYLE